MELQQLLQLEAVLPTGIYIYTTFENFGRFLKCLVYKFSIWYCMKNLYIFGRFSLVGLVKTVN